MSKKEEIHPVALGILVGLAMIVAIMVMTAISNVVSNYLDSRKPVNYICHDFHPRLSKDSPEYWDRFLDNRDVSLVIDKIDEKIWLDGRLASNASFSDIRLEAVDVKVGRFSFDTITGNLTFNDRSVSCRKPF